MELIVTTGIPEDQNCAIKSQKFKIIQSWYLETKNTIIYALYYIRYGLGKSLVDTQRASTTRVRQREIRDKR